MRPICIFAAFLFALTSARGLDDPNAPVVTVNGEAITRGDIGMRVLARLLGEGKPVDTARDEGEIDRLAPQVTTELVVEKLLDQAARKEGLQPTEAQVDSGVEAFRNSVPEGVTYSDYLRSYGTTGPIVREDIARNLRVKMLVEKVTATLDEPEESVLQAAYAKNKDKLRADVLRARHILIAVPEGATDEERAMLRKRAEAALERVSGEGAEDFGAVAKELSDGSSAERGGAIEEFPRGFLEPAFDAAAFALEPGETSGIVETSAGFHIINLQEKREDAPLSYTTAKNRLRDEIYGRKHNAVVRRLIYELRAAAELEWAQGAAPPPAETGEPGE